MCPSHSGAEESGTIAAVKTQVRAGQSSTMCLRSVLSGGSPGCDGSTLVAREPGRPVSDSDLREVTPGLVLKQAWCPAWAGGCVRLLVNPLEELFPAHQANYRDRISRGVRCDIFYLDYFSSYHFS